MGKYSVLLRVAELKNVTKVSKELGYSQPNISYLIRKAEEELGVRLFNRGNRSILSLTPAGAELLPLMQQVETLEQSIERIAHLYQNETLRIGSFYSACVYWLPPILKRFTAEHPTVKITIIERDTYTELEAMLSRGEIDCCLYAGNYDHKFDHTFLCKDDYYIVTSRTHPLAEKERVSMEELSHYPFIVPSEALCSSVSQTAVRNIKTYANIMTQNQEDLATVNLVEQGLGISLLPGLVALNTTRNICAIPLEENLSRNVGILYFSKQDAPSIVKAFVKTTKEFVDALPQ